MREMLFKKRLIILCSFLLLSFIITSAQGVSLNFSQKNLKTVLEEISQQTGYSLAYSKEVVNLNDAVSIQVSDARLSDVLNELLLSRNLNYEVKDNKIYILHEAPAVTKKSDVTQQNVTISGIVTDQNDEPIIGANITIPRTSIGTITDVDGRYTLSVPKGSMLTFTYIGYDNQNIRITNQKTVNVSMTEDTEVLEELVVIGYGTIKKSDLTGSVSQVSSDVIRRQSVTKDPLQILQGKVPGLDITTGNKPGDVSTPIIRGYNSLNASNAPLIVLDGAPFAGRLSDINSSEIETIDILKDASSTAIYGSRGANGVIIITTKRAKMGSRTEFTYDGYFGISKSFKSLDMMDGTTWADFRRAANPTQMDSELFSQVELDILEQKNFTDWQKVMFDRTGFETDHNFSLSSSRNNMSNVIVLGYNKNQSIVKNMSYERFSARINGDIKVTDNIMIGYSTMASHSKRDNGDDYVFYAASILNPITQVYDDNGEILFYPSTISESFQQTSPLFDIDSKNLENQSFRDRVFFNVFGEWEMISGLKFKSSLTADWQFLQDGNYYSPNTHARLQGTNSSSFNKITEKSINFTNILNYNKEINENAFNISLVHDMQQYKMDRVGLSGEDVAYYGKWYNVSEAPEIFTRNSSFNEWALLSFMGRINYTLKDRYLFTLTGRSDGSSRLAKNNKWDFFPSAAFAWRISSESFMEPLTVISNMKLRLSWGNTGNTAINPYATQGALGRFPYVFGASEEAAIGYLPKELANVNLGWESTEEYNLGLDFGFLKNRINGTLDFYRRDTHDLLMKRSLPISSGYDNTWQNIGETRNQGIEIALNTVVIDTKEWKWDLNVSFAYNKNEIRKLYSGKEDDPGNKWFIGKPLYVDWLYDFDGIWQLGEEEEAAIYGRKPGDAKVEDKNDSKNYDQEDLVIHNRIPKWTGGISSSLSYKNFDLNVYAYTRQNYGEVIGVLATQAGASRHNHINVDFWTPENPSTTFPKPIGSNAQPLLEQSNYAFRDLSFIRLKNINLGYNFKAKSLQKIKAEQIRLYIAVDNPYVWTMNKFEGLDPENMKSYSDHRPLTSFILGVNVNF